MKKRRFEIFSRWYRLKSLAKSWAWEPPVDIVRPSEQSQAETKICRVCGTPKPISEFYASSGRVCKKCWNAKRKDQKHSINGGPWPDELITLKADRNPKYREMIQRQLRGEE